MLSKVGRFLNENYTIFRSKEQILNDSIKKPANSSKFKGSAKSNPHDKAKKNLIKDMKTTDSMPDNDDIYKALRKQKNLNKEKEKEKPLEEEVDP